MPIQIIIGLALGAAIFIPALRICHRTGLRWPIALLVFIPLAGPLLLLVLLSFMIWPNDPAARR